MQKILASLLLVFTGTVFCMEMQQGVNKMALSHILNSDVQEKNSYQQKSNQSDLFKFKCDQCPASFVLITGLSYHHYYKHAPNYCKVPGCPKGGTEFKGKTKLRTHIRNTHEILDVHYCANFGCPNVIKNDDNAKRNLTQHGRNCQYRAKNINNYKKK